MSQYPRAAIVLATVGALAATDARAQPTPMSVPTAVAPLNSAAADVDLGSVDTGPPASPTRRARHAIYVEALGRAGGVAGLGYGYQISRRVGVGAHLDVERHHPQRRGPRHLDREAVGRLASLGGQRPGDGRDVDPRRGRADLEAARAQRHHGRRRDAAPPRAAHSDHPRSTPNHGATPPRPTSTIANTRVSTWRRYS